MSLEVTKKMKDSTKSDQSKEKKSHFRRGLVCFNFLVISLVTVPCNVWAQTESSWMVFKKASYLQKELPKKTKSKKIMLSSSDFDSHYLFPCKSTALDEREERGESADTGDMLPRLLLVNSEKTEVWVCAAADSLRQIGAGRFRFRDSFRIFSRLDGGIPQMIAEDGEVVARPYELRISGSNLQLVKNLSTANLQTSSFPLTSRQLNCTQTKCNFSKERCALSSVQLSSTQVLNRFDKAVARYKAKPTVDADKSKPFQYLDQLLVLAVKGNAKAKKRLAFFPIDISGSLTGVEILTSYLASLKEAQQLCR